MSNDTETLDAAAVAAIRQDERQRIADLVDKNAETLGGFAGDKLAAVKLVAMCIRQAGA